MHQEAIPHTALNTEPPSICRSPQPGGGFIGRQSTGSPPLLPPQRQAPLGRGRGHCGWHGEGELLYKNNRDSWCRDNQGGGLIQFLISVGKSRVNVPFYLHVTPAWWWSHCHPIKWVATTPVSPETGSYFYPVP